MAPRGLPEGDRQLELWEQKSEPQRFPSREMLVLPLLLCVRLGPVESSQPWAWPVPRLQAPRLRGHVWGQLGTWASGQR